MARGRRWLPLVVIVVVAASAWRLGEPEACRDPDFDYSALDSAALGRIASACRDSEVARLYYNRAYYAGLFEGRLTADDPHLVQLAASHRIYMGMIEAFAREWFPEREARLRFLNAQYERMSTIAELRLRRYHLQEPPVASGALPLP